MRSVKWIDLPVIFNHRPEDGKVVIDEVTLPTMADVDAYIKVRGDELNRDLLEDWNEQTL
jgi:hypothetical protein